MEQEFQIIRRNDALFIGPACDLLRSLLTFETREIVYQKQEIKTEIEYSEEEFVTESGTRVLRTWPGYWGYLRAALRSKGYQVTIIDQTLPTPEPQIGQAMIGLKPPQQALMLQFLMARTSGMVAAPTRYGKSRLMMAAARAFPNSRIVITAPGVSLCRQLLEDFMIHLPTRVMFADYSGAPKKRLKERNAELAYADPQSAPWIWFCTPESLVKVEHGRTDAVLIDEPHAYSTDSRRLGLMMFHKALKLAFGATLTGRFDRADFKVESVVGPILAATTYKEAVAANMISPLVVAIVTVKFRSAELYGRLDRNMLYAQTFTESPKASAVVKSIFDHAIPKDWQTMGFIMHEKHAEYALAHCVPVEGTIVMAKRMSDKERHKMTDAIAAGHYKRVLASNIYVQGVTFPELRVVVNLAGGGANTTAIQKPGRLLQKFPGKRYGVLIDFLFVCEEDQTAGKRADGRHGQLVGESWARINKYKDIGYDVRFIKTIPELRDVVLQAWEGSDVGTLFPNLKNGTQPDAENVGGLLPGAGEADEKIRSAGQGESGFGRASSSESYGASSLPG